MFKSYLKLYLGFCITCIVLITGVNYLFLRNSGEFTSLEDIYHRQHDNKDELCVYGTSIFDRIVQYKLFNYEKINPQVITIGSSRMLGFRKDFFSSHFYNMGFTISSVPQAKYVFDRILAHHTPETIIMGVDFWWFNDNSPSQKNKPFKIKNPRMTITNFFKSLRLIKEGKITFQDYIDIAFGLDKTRCDTGIRGLINKSGFAPDGSFYYADSITGKETRQETFAQMEASITVGNKDHFEHAKIASAQHLKTFLTLLDAIKKKNVNLVLYFPPLAPRIFDHMGKYPSEYSYIEDLKHQLRQKGITFYDFTDPRILLNTTNCEFVDGTHSGDVMAARIPHYLRQQEPVLSSRINDSYLYTTIKKYSGLAMIPNDKITSSPEVDFLNIGCKKDVRP